MSDVFTEYDANLLTQLLCANELELEDTNTEIPDFNILNSGEKANVLVRHNAERFRTVEFSDVDKFLEETENENTKRKTLSDIKLFKTYLLNTGETTEIECLSVESLNEKFSTFLLSVTKKDGSEYEPSTLRGFWCSLDRYLRLKNSKLNINVQAEFAKCRTVLRAKQKQLKSLGYGNKPNAADELTDQDIEKLFEHGLLGVNSPLALVNLLHLTFTTTLGMRGGKEQKDLKLGDIEIGKDSSGEEFIQHVKERQTKTRTGEDPANTKIIKTKAWANQNPEKCPVNALRLYRSKRPDTMNKPDSPFYLTVNHTVDPRTHQWYKTTPMGINHIYGLTKQMIKSCPELADNSRKLTNHSKRKHLIQKLQDKGVQNPQIMQISGHKNVASVLSYSKLNQDQQKNISKIIADTEGKVNFDNGQNQGSRDPLQNVSNRQLCISQPQENSAALACHPGLTHPCPPALPYPCPSNTQSNTMSSDTRLSSFFQGNTYIYGGTFNFNSGNNGISAQKHEQLSDTNNDEIVVKPKYKRILPLSFSDSE